MSLCSEQRRWRALAWFSTPSNEDSFQCGCCSFEVDARSAFCDAIRSRSAPSLEGEHGIHALTASRLKIVAGQTIVISLARILLRSKKIFEKSGRIRQK